MKRNIERGSDSKRNSLTERQSVGFITSNVQCSCADSPSELGSLSSWFKGQVKKGKRGPLTIQTK